MKQETYIAKTLMGLEDVLAEEIRQLGGRNIRIGRRMVSFEGEKTLLYKANINLRTAVRILKPLLTFKASDADEVYETLKHYPWETVLTGKQTFAIDTVVYSEHFKHARFLAYKAKDAVADYFREKTGQRPSVRITNPDIPLHIHVSHDQCDQQSWQPACFCWLAGRDNRISSTPCAAQAPYSSKRPSSPSTFRPASTASVLPSKTGQTSTLNSWKH